MTTQRIRVRTDGAGKNIQIINVAGILDIQTVRQFEKLISSLIAEGNRRLIVNLKNCDYISSAGLGVLMGAAKELRRNGGDIRLLHLSEKIRRIIGFLGFDRVLEIYDVEEDAILSFK